MLLYMYEYNMPESFAVFQREAKIDSIVASAIRFKLDMQNQRFSNATAALEDFIAHTDIDHDTIPRNYFHNTSF